MAYGAVRGKTSQLLAPITARVPFGGMSDEIVIATLAFYGKKKVKNPMLKNVLNAALIVESARIGEVLATGGLSGNSSSTVGQIF